MTWASFKVSTKNSAKALAPSSVCARAAAGTFTVAVLDGRDELDEGLEAELVLEAAVLVAPADDGLGCASAPSLQLVSANAPATLAVTMAALAYPVKTLPISTWAASPVATVQG